MNTQINSSTQNQFTNQTALAGQASFPVPVIDETNQGFMFHVKRLVNNELVNPTDSFFTLLVNGIPTLKLTSDYELPEETGSESWALIDSEGNYIAAYFPV